MAQVSCKLSILPSHAVLRDKDSLLELLHVKGKWKSRVSLMNTLIANWIVYLQHCCARCAGNTVTSQIVVDIQNCELSRLPKPPELEQIANLLYTNLSLLDGVFL